MSGLSAGIDGNHKANAGSRISSRKSSFADSEGKPLIYSKEQLEANGLLIKSESRSSSTSVTSVKKNALAQFDPKVYNKWTVAIAPTPELLASAASAGKSICDEYNLKVAPGSMILAAATSVAKSNHKARNWGTRDTVRHLVLTRDYASGNVTLSVYKNVAPRTSPPPPQKKKQANDARTELHAAVQRGAFRRKQLKEGREKCTQRTRFAVRNDDQQ